MPTRPPAAIADTARALAHEACSSILRALSAPQQVHEAVHSARKSIRHLRALLQLIGDRVPDAQRADRILRRVGDSLSRLRDAHVAITTASRFLTEDEPELWLPVVQHLTHHRDSLLERTLARDPAFARRRARIERVARRLEQLDWDRIRARDLRRGLEQGQRRVEKAARRATKDPNPDNLHRWRRRVRKLRMQLQAVEHIAPDIARAAAQSGSGRRPAALRALSDQLGDYQDLEVLQTLLDAIPALPQRAELRARIRARAIPPPLPG